MTGSERIREQLPYHPQLSKVKVVRIHKIQGRQPYGWAVETPDATYPLGEDLKEALAGLATGKPIQSWEDECAAFDRGWARCVARTLAAVDAEDELADPMPESLQGVDPAELARSAVRVTKRNIRERIERIERGNP